MNFKERKDLIAPNAASGFTLLELILASLITTIVVTITGIGLLNLSSSDIRNTAEKELINNFNRASSFISDELRQAREVVAAGSIETANIASMIRPIPVLGIVHPDPNVTRQIVYFTAERRSQDRLIGPRVLYRYGPDIGDDGTYNTANWNIFPVADLIAERYDRLPDNCTSGTRIPPTGTTIDGFWACVNGTNRVNFRIYGAVPLEIAGSPRITYETSTSVFTRSATPSPSPSPSASPSPSPSPSP